MYWHALTILCDDNATPREILTVYQLFMAFCSAKWPSRASRYNNFAHIFCRKPSGRTRRRPFLWTTALWTMALQVPWMYWCFREFVHGNSRPYGEHPALLCGLDVLPDLRPEMLGTAQNPLNSSCSLLKLAIWLVYPCFGHRNLNSGSSRLVPLHIQGHHTTGVFTLPSCRGFPESPVADDTTKRST